MEHLVVADTDVIIDYFSGVEPFAQHFSKLIENDFLILTSITVFELYAGIMGSKRLEQIDSLLSVVNVFSFKTEDAVAAVGVYNRLRQEGKLIGIQDIMIAGICMNRKQPLLTRNSAHFSRIPGLKLINA